jgi:prevent-host-death family protein
VIHIGESDFLWAFEALSEMARKEPVAVTKNGHDRLVVMSVEEYRRLQLRDAHGRTATSGAGCAEAEIRAAE